MDTMRVVAHMMERRDILPHAVAEADKWMLTKDAAIVADRSELLIQATGYAELWAGQFARQAKIAADAFVDRVRHLAGDTTVVIKDDDDDEASGSYDDFFEEDRSARIRYDKVQREGDPYRVSASRSNPGGDRTFKLSSRKTASIRSQAAQEDWTNGWAGPVPDTNPDGGYSSWGTRILPDGTEVRLYRGRNNRIRFYDAQGNQHGEEQSNVAPAFAYAEAQGWHDPDSVRNHFNPIASRKTAVEGDRPLYEIAREIRQDWKNVYFGAVPYLDAMRQLDSIEDMYGADDAYSIVAYFLSNANTWRGEVAKRIKAELKAMLKRKYGSRTASWGKTAWTEDGSDITPMAQRVMEIDSKYNTGGWYVDGRSTNGGPSRDEATQKIADEIKTFVDQITDADQDVLADYNFHAANAAIDMLKGVRRYSLHRKAVSLTGVGFEGGIGSNTAYGYDANGVKVTFRLSEQDAKDLAFVMTSDLAINFSGVDVDEADITARGSHQVTAADGDKSFCRICGRALEQMEYIWYALSASPAQRPVGAHTCVPARLEGRSGEFGPDGVLVPGSPGGEGGQYDAPAGTIFDGGGNPIKVSSSRKQAVDGPIFMGRPITNAEQARDAAIEWAHNFDQETYSWGDLADWGNFFEDLAQRYPELREEFVENGIISEGARHQADQGTGLVGGIGFNTADGQTLWTDVGNVELASESVTASRKTAGAVIILRNTGPGAAEIVFPGGTAYSTGLVDGIADNTGYPLHIIQEMVADVRNAAQTGIYTIDVPIYPESPLYTEGARSRRAHQCVYTGETNHSDDILAVYHGSTEPTYICGYHEQRWGVPGTGRYTRDTGKTAARKTASLPWKHMDGFGWYVNPADFAYGYWAKIEEEMGGYVLLIIAASGDDFRADQVVKEIPFSNLEDAKAEGAAQAAIYRATRPAWPTMARKVAYSTEGPWKVQVTGNGENVWSENALRFASQEEAAAYASDLLGRWFGADMARVVSSDTPNRAPVEMSDPAIVINYRKTGSRGAAASFHTASYITVNGVDFDYDYYPDPEWDMSGDVPSLIVTLNDAETGDVIDAFGGVEVDFEVSDHGNTNVDAAGEAYIKEVATEMAKAQARVASRSSRFQATFSPSSDYTDAVQAARRAITSGARDASDYEGSALDDEGRYGSRRVTASTCSVCGDTIERDPEGEENRSWHHNDGSTHDHEAQPSKESSRKQAADVTRFDDGHSEWKCNRCGDVVERWPGEGDVECASCGAQYNASGQQLRDDWAGNPSNYDDDISDLDGYEMQHAYEGSRKQAMPTPADLGVQVGDIFYNSWGYDQTNIDFYEVIRLTGQGVEVQPINARIVGASGQQNMVVPVPGSVRDFDVIIGVDPNSDKKSKVCKLTTGYRGQPGIVLKSGQYWGYRWEGSPLAETDSMFGH